MSGTQRLLAWIKALFGPSRPPAPTPELEETPVRATTVPDLAEAQLPEPIATAPQPTFDETPAVVAASPAVVEEAPALVAAPPTLVEEPLAAIEEPPAVIEEAPAVIEEAPAAVEEAPTVVAEAPTVAAEAPGTVEQAPTDAQPMVPAALSGALTLKLETERGSRSTFEVTKSGATIGRGPESTIQLADLSVSRKHAKITYRQGAYWLSDLGSMGGTWIDGTKLAAPRRVAMGQTIDIGLCRLRVISTGADEKSPAARGPSHAA